MSKSYKLTEVKGQGRIRIMNVRNTSSHGDRPMCQIWHVDWSKQKKLRSGHESAQIVGETDTHRYSDSYIPPELRSRDYGKRLLISSCKTNQCFH